MILPTTATRAHRDRLVARHQRRQHECRLFVCPSLRWRALVGAVLACVLALSGQALGDARESPTSYVVQPGDTLLAVATATGVSAERLAQINGLANPDLIFAGQVLHLHGGGETGPARYTVQPGDTLFGIASTHGVPADALTRWNGIPNPDFIVAGTVLEIWAGSQQAAAASIPRVDWIGSPNFWAGRPHGAPIALALHTADGTLDGTAAEFADPNSLTSAHFGIGLDGRVHQYVELKDRAWANGMLEAGNSWPGPPDVNPNDLSVSLETEDLGDAYLPVSRAQFEATVAIGRLIISRYPTIRYLVSHRAIAPLNRPDCPGPRWITSGQFTALANALKLKPIA